MVDAVRRAMVGASLLSPVLASMPARASAVFPTRPVQVVVPYAAGGGIDFVVRLLFKKVAQQTGHAFVIDNKPGATGNVAAAAVSRAAGDGHTLLVATVSTHGINQYTMKNMPYDPVKDFIPVAMLADSALVLFAHRGFPPHNLADAVSLIRSKPRYYVYGSPGSGSVFHLAMAQFCNAMGLEMEHVGYKGAAPATIDLAAGHIPLMIGSLPPAAPFIQNKQIKVLAVASDARPSGMTGVARFMDLAPDVKLRSWFGLMAPKDTPAEIAERLNQMIATALSDEEIQGPMREQGFGPNPMSRRDFGVLVEEEMSAWKRAVQTAGIRAE